MTNQARKVIEIAGEDRVHFLQGLITNDVKRLENGAVYAALLTPQGKFLVDFFLIPEGDVILLDAPASEAEMLLKRLSMYKLRSKVTLTPTERSVSRGVGPVPEGAFADPRAPEMGWRAYDGRPSEEADWDAIRVEHCIPEFGAELTPDTFILEAGFDRLHGVDFKKGCYVGQEVTARMKHKTELRKGLKTVAIDGSAPVGTEIVTESGKTAGTLFTQSGDKAIAYLRFDRAKGPLTAGEAKVSA
ncbi:CAF17-like 4Fe-4S cluster assembly/insertion protein YgfZ [Celeribacter litoreus]|uniref:CAF17-like 4Fe-4S cluster assembly/insertion protein YgfZ n=1 Tax=Celeribacter litoreus TaxID=2876714 RepID=UPI001CCAAB14|nr:folate-binding protein [Celeribacter litoreus]MCA0045128.1 folate-binding protein [Celeribacter litoreus]